ncbi:MAG TPA: hypothetical protein VF574_18730 [Allosphingosinicella sp.]|jgi:hypothetical protein
MARETPAPVHQPKQPEVAPAARGPEAPAQPARCLGATAQLAAVRRTLRHGSASPLPPHQVRPEAPSLETPRLHGMPSPTRVIQRAFDKALNIGSAEHFATQFSGALSGLPFGAKRKLYSEIANQPAEMNRDQVNKYISENKSRFSSAATASSPDSSQPFSSGGGSSSSLRPEVSAVATGPSDSSSSLQPEVPTMATSSPASSLSTGRSSSSLQTEPATLATESSASSSGLSGGHEQGSGGAAQPSHQLAPWVAKGRQLYASMEAGLAKAKPDKDTSLAYKARYETDSKEGTPPNQWARAGAFDKTTKLARTRAIGTEATAYENYVDVTKGVIGASYNYADKDLFEGHQKEGRLNNSEILWNQYAAAVEAEGGNPSGLNSIYRLSLASNAQTIMDLMTWRGRKLLGSRQGMEFGPNDDEFYALLATDNCKGITFLVVDHANALGRKKIIRIWAQKESMRIDLG